MVEGKGIGIGIGIGVVTGILIGIIVSGGIGTSTQSNPIADIIPDIIQTDDAYLASIDANYNHKTDKLSVTLILTNKDGDYTKANGNLQLRVHDDAGRKRLSTEYDVTRDDFFSWKTNSGEKITGYRIQETKVFASYNHDVYVDFTLNDGTNWKDLHASFFSLN